MCPKGQTTSRLRMTEVSQFACLEPALYRVSFPGLNLQVCCVLALGKWLSHSRPAHGADELEIMARSLLTPVVCSITSNSDPLLHSCV